MPALSDGAIRKALKRVEETRKQENLLDGEGRKTGRLMLSLKPMPTRVTADWMVQQWTGDKRKKRKIGSYPAMTLATAREVFKRDYATAILKGRSIKLTEDTRPGTLSDLFQGYVDWLESENRSTCVEAGRCLGKVAKAIGGHRPARDIEPEEIVLFIRPIYDRGRKVMADKFRGFIKRAFDWGLNAELDYRHTTSRRFFLPFNPAASIPSEKLVPSNRWLDEQEFADLYIWLLDPTVKRHTKSVRIIQLLMLTGQRVSEISTLHVDQWNPAERTLTWTKTKNGRPHCIPVPSLAAEILNGIRPNKYGFFFPRKFAPQLPFSQKHVGEFNRRMLALGQIPNFRNGDLRRTWKTLAAKAGLSKDIRDRLQNHTLHDVSSKHYDRWEYLPEKYEAVDRWDSFVRDLICRVQAARTMPPTPATKRYIYLYSGKSDFGAGDLESIPRPPSEVLTIAEALAKKFDKLSVKDLAHAVRGDADAVDDPSRQWRRIVDAMKKSDDVQLAAAKLLGIHPRTLARRIEREKRRQTG